MTVTPTAQREQYVTVPLEPVNESSELTSIILEQDNSNARPLVSRVTCTPDLLRGTLCITTVVLLILGFALMMAGAVQSEAAVMWTGAGIMVSSLPVYAGFTYVNGPRT